MQVLREHTEAIGSEPEWIIKTVAVAGGVTKEPIKLYYREPMEIFEYLFSSPIFKNHCDYKPRRVWTNEDEKTRVYSEMMTGDFAWNTQVCDSFRFDSC